MAASRIRASIVFILLDAVCVVAGFGLAEVAYFRDRAPAHYWEHFAEFLLVAVIVTLMSNRLFGLYGRMWRHAGSEEARQIVLSSATILCVLIAFWPVGRSLRVELVPPIVVVVGCMFSAAGQGVLRFHSRLFAWQRGSKRMGLRVAVIGSRDTGAAAIREMLRTTGCRSSAYRWSGGSPTSPRPPAATRSSRSCWPSPLPHPSSSSGRCWPPRVPACR
jgi:FlaA1/EpsC-like NDP-sugar epimerase